MSKKVNIELIRESMREEGYTLVSSVYVNNKQPLDYICPEGHKHSISWNSWSNKGVRCWYCFGTPKKTIEFIRSEFEKEGYKLLTTKYNSNAQKLNYICIKGHKHYIAWNSWLRGSRCPYCVGLAKPTLSFIKGEFEKEGYTLLSTEYINAMSKLQYICPVGHRHSIRWNDWKNGVRCFKCKYIKQSGAGNPSWKGGTSFEPYCPIWKDKEYKESIKQRDEYKCLNPDCWCRDGRLHVHHIDYNKKNCGPNNLITLCGSCNARANKDRKWHKAWYQAIIKNRYLGVSNG